MKKLYTFLLLSVLFFTAQAHARFADDTDIASWAWDSVYDVEDAKIMTGFSDNTFRPKQELNRAQALVVLFRTKKIDLDSLPDRGLTFKDVPANAWFTKAVSEAYHLGWMKGYPDGTFKPEQKLNKAEWAVLIQRAFDLKSEEPSQFIDVPQGSWFEEAVASLEGHSVIRLYTRDFAPTRKVTRADAAWDIATILQRPAILGTSTETTHQQSGRVRNSKELIFKPKDFNPNKQGVEEKREEVLFLVEPLKDTESITVFPHSDWQKVGTLRVENNYNVSARYDGVEFKMIFDESTVGPASAFVIQVRGEGFQSIKPLATQGAILVPGFDKTLAAGESAAYEILIKPAPNEGYYREKGTGEIRLASSSVTTSNQERGIRPGRVGYDTFVFTPIVFDPSK